MLKEKRAVFYYIRDKGNRPVVTVCLLTGENENISRGVSVCSINDNPCRKTGKAIALGRARKALGKEMDSDNLNFKKMPFSVVSPVINQKISMGSEFAPVLSDYERKILNRG